VDVELEFQRVKICRLSEAIVSHTETTRTGRAKIKSDRRVRKKLIRHASVAGMNGADFFKK